jgi:hypothetical protein
VLGLLAHLMPWVALLVLKLGDEGLYFVVHGFAASLGWLHFMKVCFSFQAWAICKHTYIQTYTCAYAYTLAYMHTCTCTCTLRRMHMRICTCVVYATQQKLQPDTAAPPTPPQSIQVTLGPMVLLVQEMARA